MADRESPDPDQLLDLFDRLRKQALGQNSLDHSGVSGPRLALLNWVADSPGRGVREIAEGLELTASTVSVGVHRLGTAGLLERRPDPEDGRAIQVFLTANGQTLHRQARTFRRRKMQRLLAGLTSEEGATLLALLEKAIIAAEEETGQPDIGDF
jgi:DNA-binding MarR family transcriptional regulator